MFKSKAILSIALLSLCQFCFCNITGEPVFSKKETLYSTKNGSPIGDLMISIEAKNDNAKNNEWNLIIGDKSNNIIDSGNDGRTVWIFNKKVSANTFKKDMKNRDYPIDVKGLSEFMPFCENGIRFDLKEWEEIRKQTQFSFFINASPGEKITLRLVFYISSKDKKKLAIEDEAKVKLEFVVPDPSSAKKTQATQVNQDAGDEISLTEKIDYEAAAKINEERKADSIKQAEAEDKSHRIVLLNSFITERNNEINSLQEEVNVLLTDKKNKVEAIKIDSFETVVDELKKKVDYWENGYTDILLTEEGIHDKFTKFGTTHGITSKKLVELRQQQSQLNNWMSYLKSNWLLSIVILACVLIFGKLLLKLVGKLKSMVKKQYSQKVNKMKMKAQIKQKVKSMRNTEKTERQKDFDNIDISELDEI